mmetsp:Transcript_22274/g.55683  ORF Transcript_22274/g.55683 Transcript_22274/m.55683 type:complete len:249 (+) Transcript_22274:131-877(+)
MRHVKTNDGYRARASGNRCKRNVVARGQKISEKSARSQNSISQAELLDGILPCQQLSRDDAKRSEHREAAVVQLPGAHLLVVLPQAQRVAKVARLLRWVLRPHTELQGSGDKEQRDHAVAAGSASHRCQPRGHFLEAGELHIVLDHRAQRRHHRNTAVLDLGGAEGAEARLVALLAEARWVEVSQGRHGPELDGRVEGRLRGLRACDTFLAALGEAASPSGGRHGSTRLRRCLGSGARLRRSGRSRCR